MSHYTEFQLQLHPCFKSRLQQSNFSVQPLTYCTNIGQLRAWYAWGMRDHLISRSDLAAASLDIVIGKTTYALDGDDGDETWFIPGGMKTTPGGMKMLLVIHLSRRANAQSAGSQDVLIFPRK